MTRRDSLFHHFDFDTDFVEPSPLTSRFALSPDGEQLLGLRYAPHQMVWNADEPYRLFVIEDWREMLLEVIAGR